MKDLREYILESKVVTTLSNVLPSINFKNPTMSDAKELEKILKKEGLFPNYTKLDNRYITYKNWYIDIKDDNLALKYTGIITKPFKRSNNIEGSLIEFYNDALLASDNGVVLYKAEVPITWEKIVIPIANFFGLKYNGDGEFLASGAKSKWM